MIGRSVWFVMLISAAALITGCNRILYVTDDGGVRKIHQMNSGGSNQELVSPANATVYTFPDVSPDGAKVAYTDGQQIFISNLGDIGGNSQIQLSTGPGKKTWLRWAPSQLVIGYNRFSPANQGSVRLSATSGVNFLQATFPTGSESDNGGLDFYLGSNGVQNLIYSRDGRLYTMFFNGTQPATAITNPSGTSRHTIPVVSHDNDLVAYRFSTQLAASGTIDAIHVLETDTWVSRHSIVLPSTHIKPGSISAIDFSCNDQRLFVAAEAASGTGSRREIFSVKFDGTGLNQLTSNAVYDSQPAAIPSPCY